MNREVISSKQGIFMIVLFILNGSLMLPTAIEAKKDLWIAILLSLALSIPIIYIYSNILSTFPGKDLFDILEYTFGKFFGKLFSLAYIWFAFHLASIILRDFGEYFLSAALPETPIIIMVITPTILCIWIVKEGIEVFGRLASLLIVIIFIIIFILAGLLISEINLDNIRPILADGIKPVIKGAYSTFTFPFAETIIFTMVLSSLDNKKGYFKVYLIGLLIGGLILFSTSFIEISTLGINWYSSLYFPGYEILTMIEVGELLNRIEIIGGLVFSVVTFIKLSICFLGATKGIAKLFNYKDYRFIVTPIALLLLNSSMIIYDSIMELVEWTSEIWPYYAIPFQIIIPIIIFIILKIKKNYVGFNNW